MRGGGVLQPLEIDILRKTFVRADGSRLEAVRGLKIAVPAGEVTCLIGPSGCGKTTILRIITGLDRDFGGRVEPAADALSIGMVFQEPRLLPWRTVEQNVRLALPKARRNTDIGTILAELGLSEWAKRHPGELSLGMARRVSLARALAIDPDLLVLDEPFVSLDERAAMELRGYVFAAVSRKRMTVLMVTHNLREALELADRLILLTPRPASLLAEIPLALPRASRGERWIEQERRKLTETYPAVLA